MRSWWPLIVLAVSVAAPLHGQNMNPARPRAEEMVEWWNHIGNKLVVMAKDFPEEKYDFRLQRDERSFAESLLHVAAVDFDLASQISGARVGAGFDQGHS